MQQDQIPLLNAPRLLAAVVDMGMDMGCSIPYCAGLFLMVGKAVFQILCLANITGLPGTGAHLFREDVIPWNFIKGRSYGIYLECVLFS